MILYLFFLLMAINACFFLEGDIYFKFYHIFLWIAIGYVYTSVVIVYREIMRINLIIEDAQEREARMDKERFDRIKKHLQKIPEQDKSSLFDCFEDGYVIVNSEGYAVHKTYLKDISNDKAS